MRVPTTLEELLSGLTHGLRQRILTHWQLAEAEPELLVPGDVRLYELLDGCGREERWTLFDVIDNGGYSPASWYPRRMTPEGERIDVDLNSMRERGLLFLVINELGERFLVIPEEVVPSVIRYREQLLLMKLSSHLADLDAQSLPAAPIILPSQIQPHLALSQLIASSDPEGFRYPLSRALGIPDTFPSSVKRTLKRLLHEFYLLFFPCLGLLRADRSYPLDGVMTLATGIAALLSQHHSQALEAELCKEENRPFASANTLLSGARRGFWRSFVVLLLDQFLTPIGSTLYDQERVQVLSRAFSQLDLETKRSEWLIHCLQELGVEVSSSPV